MDSNLNKPDAIVLGMSGKLGVGKNYISDKFIIPRLIREFASRNVTLVPYYFSFGSFIKAQLYAEDGLDDLTFENLFVHKSSNVRERLQKFGTEMGRDKLRKDLWIRYVDIWISITLYQLQQLESDNPILPLYIIQDVRFQNELEYVQDYPNHLVVRVVAPGRHSIRCTQSNSNGTHLSEIDLDAAVFEHVLLNDPSDSENVASRVDDIVSTFVHKINLKN